MDLTAQVTPKLLGLVTPVVTLLSCISPTLAATLATSEAIVTLTDFTQAPLDVATFADTDAITWTKSGSAIAIADGFAIFNINPCFCSDNIPTFAHNYSLAETWGQGHDYAGFAQSNTGILGHRFLITEEQDFSFNFNFLSFLGLESLVDNPQTETAQAAGQIAFYLFDDLTGNLLDFFNLQGFVTSSGNHDFFKWKNSDGFQFSFDEANLDWNGNQKSTHILLSGFYHRQFNQEMSLTLVEYKQSQAIVKTPEPSTTVAFFIFSLFGAGLSFKKQSKSSD